MKKYDETINAHRLNEKFADVDKVKADLEYSSLLEEIEDLLNGIEEGGKRTADIVRGFVIFQDWMKMK